VTNGGTANGNAPFSGKAELDAHNGTAMKGGTAKAFKKAELDAQAQRPTAYAEMDGRVVHELH